MSSAYDIYTFYLEPKHLRNQSVVVHVESVTADDVFNPRIKRNERKLVMRFHGKKLSLCLNKTQTSAMIEITSTDNYTKWQGHTITLTPTVDNGRETITITKPPQPQSKPDTQTNKSPAATVTEETEEKEGDDPEQATD